MHEQTKGWKNLKEKNILFSVSEQIFFLFVLFVVVVLLLLFKKERICTSKLLSNNSLFLCQL